MKIDRDQVRALCDLHDIKIPEEELQDIANRMTLWLTAMEDIEADLGTAINEAEPVPPVFPHKDYRK